MSYIKSNPKRYINYYYSNDVCDFDGNYKSIISFDINPLWIKKQNLIKSDIEIEKAVKQGKPINKKVNNAYKTNLWNSLLVSIQG